VLGRNTICFRLFFTLLYFYHLQLLFFFWMRMYCFFLFLCWLNSNYLIILGINLLNLLIIILQSRFLTILIFKIVSYFFFCYCFLLSMLINSMFSSYLWLSKIKSSINITHHLVHTAFSLSIIPKIYTQWIHKITTNTSACFWDLALMILLAVTTKAISLWNDEEEEEGLSFDSSNISLIAFLVLS